jgi:hypothetical protein
MQRLLREKGERGLTATVRSDGGLEEGKGLEKNARVSLTIST